MKSILPQVTSQTCLGILLTLCITNSASGGEPSTGVIRSVIKLDHPQAGDQDDLCFWYDSERPGESRIITSDKKSGIVAVYDLKGTVKQTVAISKPGNIDIRQGVDSLGKKRDIVAVNQRTDGWKLVLFEMNRETRVLERLDKGDLTTGPNYGVALYYNRELGTLDAITTSEDDDVEQYRISFTAEGRVESKLLREWKLGKCEGAVADDEFGRLYIAVEEQGVWELSADSNQSVPGDLVIRLGDHGLKPDLEGITLVRKTGGQGYLLLSSQGQNRFYAFKREGKHEFIGSFEIEGAEESDGIDVINYPLGDNFKGGAFGCHTAVNKNPCILLSSWAEVANKLSIEP